MSTHNLFEHYEEASALLSSQDVMASPAELHGVLCGLLCGGAPIAKSLWLQEFNDLVNDGAPLPEGVTSSSALYLSVVPDIVYSSSATA